MTFRRLVALAFLAITPATAPALAASFDCTKAGTPFELAICNAPELSKADDVLAKSFATAIGGLTEASVTLMRDAQRKWLDYAQRACTSDAEPMTTGSYDDQGTTCLVDKFSARSGVLEHSRMIGGHRFMVASDYGALPDLEEVDNPDSYWKVANHELALPQLDSDDALADKFNPWMMQRGEALADTLSESLGSDTEGTSTTSDSSVIVAVKEVGGLNRITMTVNTYWYGHGAAHGNWSINYLHYFVPEAREVEASDIFTGDDWQKTLADAAWTQLKVEHKDALQVSAVSEIAELVGDPTRWDLSSDYGLVLQFQPYEVSSYAYGAPTITIAWDKLEAIKAANQDTVRYGW